jgi:hypothetical protein
MTIVGEDTGAAVALGPTATVADAVGGTAVSAASGAPVGGGMVTLGRTAAVGAELVVASSWPPQAAKSRIIGTKRIIEIPFARKFMAIPVLWESSMGR